MYACSERLQALWEDVDKGWRAGVDSGGMQRAALDRALAMLRGRCEKTVGFVAHRLLFWELREEIAISLYAQSVSSPPQQMAAIIAPLLSMKQAELVQMIDPDHAAEIVMAVLVASCAAFERVLLGGGRSFSHAEGVQLEEELETLIDVFLLDLNNSSGCKLDSDAVGAAAHRIRSVVYLFKRTVLELTKLYRGEAIAEPPTPKPAAAPAAPPVEPPPPLTVSSVSAPPLTVSPSDGPAWPSTSPSPVDAPPRANPFAESPPAAAAQLSARADPSVGPSSGATSGDANPFDNPFDDGVAVPPSAEVGGCPPPRLHRAGTICPASCSLTAACFHYPGILLPASSRRLPSAPRRLH